MSRGPAGRPDDPVALVTGGSGGIGAAICRQLAGDGYHVLVGYRSNPEAATQVAGSCASAVPQQVDVADPDSIDAAVAAAGAAGTVAALVNNAGVADDDLLLRLDAERIDATLRVNLRGAMLATKAVVRPMMRGRWGRVVNISSIVALRGNAGQSLYGAAKAGLIGFTKSTAREVARKGVTVNAVAPGYVETAMTAELADGARDALRDLAPNGRAVTVDEVAAAVAFLASEAASAITGAVIPVDGGAAI